jgi:hypothetical protein
VRVCLELTVVMVHINLGMHGYPVLIMMVAGVREIKPGYPWGTRTKKRLKAADIEQ